MLRSRGDYEPAKPQERQEFNKEKANSKARAAPADEQLEGGRVHADGTPDRGTADDHSPGARPAGGDKRERGPADQEPVVNLDPAKARSPGHCVRSSSGSRSCG